jgi:peptide-methionine (S)-S-oxide reductase
MKKILLAALAALFVFAAPAFAKPQTALFAGGCFWCMEHDMGAIPGVTAVMSGYTGGTLKNPTYQDVSLYHRGGHFEAVRVTYDDAKISYAALVERYWRLIDPTDAGGQFCDRGHSYASAIFVTPEQRAVAEASKAALIKSGKLRGKVVTEILSAGVFYEAETYHRDYAKRNAADYADYRSGCGRDSRLRQIWK